MSPIHLSIDPRFVRALCLTVHTHAVQYAGIWIAKDPMTNLFHGLEGPPQLIIDIV
jgi:hypothetical protein